VELHLRSASFFGINQIDNIDAHSLRLGINSGSFKEGSSGYFSYLFYDLNNASVITLIEEVSLCCLWSLIKSLNHFISG